MHPGDHAGHPPRQVRHPSRRCGSAGEPAPAGEAGLPAHHHDVRVCGALDLAGQAAHVTDATDASVQQHGLAADLPGGVGKVPAHAVHHKGQRLFGRIALHQHVAASGVGRHLALPPIRAGFLAAIGHPIVAVRIHRGLRDVERRSRTAWIRHRADLQIAGQLANVAGVRQDLAPASRGQEESQGKHTAQAYPPVPPHGKPSCYQRARCMHCSHTNHFQQTGFRSLIINQRDRN